MKATKKQILEAIFAIIGLLFFIALFFGICGGVAALIWTVSGKASAGLICGALAGAVMFSILPK